jgi:hypothetical protein
MGLKSLLNADFGFPVRKKHVDQFRTRESIGIHEIFTTNYTIPLPKIGQQLCFDKTIACIISSTDGDLHREN